jgi:16S rRNA (cytidine1402-2'-O)-methyltransferase
MKTARVVLIPIGIAEENSETVPTYILDYLNKCDVFFVEDLRTARRAFKKINKQFDIDSKTWYEIGKDEQEKLIDFKKALQEGKTIGIASESGCPGIADPGQLLIALAQKNNIPVKPLVGPSSILLTLMASGLNGQQFTFNGYLPIQQMDRAKKIKELEKKVLAENCTQLFIETPYRNNQLFQSLIQHLDDKTALCIGYYLTSNEEWIKTKSVGDWKKSNLDIPKQPTMFAIGIL